MYTYNCKHIMLYILIRVSTRKVIHVHIIGLSLIHLLNKRTQTHVLMSLSLGCLLITRFIYSLTLINVSL